MTKRVYAASCGTISSIDDLNKFENYDRVDFVCKKCKNISTKYVYNLKNTRELICYKCNHSITKTYKNKIHLTYTEQPIAITEDTDLSTFNTQQLVNFNCKRCGKNCTVKTVCIKYQPANKHCLCSTCKVKFSKLQKYGNENYQNIDKMQNTFMQRYGVRHPMHIREIQKRCGKKIKFDNILFDSSWEIMYYIWLRDNNISFSYHTVMLKYIENDGKEHRFFPDFVVNDKLVELKNESLIARMSNAKMQCIKDNNVCLLSRNDLKEVFEYVNTRYGKDYIKNIRKSQILI